jgi:hypothetical protein
LVEGNTPRDDSIEINNAEEHDEPTLHENEQNRQTEDGTDQTNNTTNGDNNNSNNDDDGPENNNVPDIVPETPSMSESHQNTVDNKQAIDQPLGKVVEENNDTNAGSIKESSSLSPLSSPEQSNTEFPTDTVQTNSS